MNTGGMPPRTLVAFDWNGTVVDDRSRAVRATDSVLRSRGLGEMSDQRLLATFTLPMATWFAALGVPSGDLPDVEAEWNRAMRARTARLRAGARSVLTALRDGGVRLVVVSAASDDAVGADIDASATGSLFHQVDAGVVDKAAHLNALRQPDDVLAVYVGDTEYDVAAGREAGFRTVGITGGYQAATPLHSCADAVVDTFAQLHDVLLGWCPAASTRGTI
ncbi:HAD hydrolase-like protein [Pseudonocardia sp. NPDC046786]|uniref:HAD family hydrolase n=1 Tax=Pseudonocardia sp. NPDC046786 TaxID=3155471 RepID=UPI003401D0B7